MKRLLAILLALALILALSLSAAAEDEARPEDEVVGSWYFQLEETTLCLELLPDGSYCLSVSGSPEEPLTGTWVLEDGFVWLDDSDQPLFLTGDILSWSALGAWASREEPRPIYSPAPIVEGLPLGAMDGYWVAVFLDLDGQVFSTELLGEDLDLYVEGQRAAMGGLFGDQIVDLEETDGVLSFEGEGFRTELALQADGFMRLRLSGDFEGALVYYLLPLVLNNAVVEED